MIKVGNQIIFNNAFIEWATSVEAFKQISKDQIYEVLELENMSGIKGSEFSPSDTVGIVKIKNIETGEIIDANNELDYSGNATYWCIEIDHGDDSLFRIIN